MDNGEGSADSIENRIIDLTKNKADGVTNNDIKNDIPDTPPDVWIKIVNKLLKNGTLELFQDKSQLLYKYKDPSKKTINKGADNEERVVYKIIEEAGNKGIWIRDIRFKSNLNMTQLNKVLKSLETKKIIKAVKSVAVKYLFPSQHAKVLLRKVVQNEKVWHCANFLNDCPTLIKSIICQFRFRKKKVYMLYDLEPDNSVTGGAWYQDQDFESEFVDVLNQQCHRYLVERLEESVKAGGGPLLIKNRSYVTANDVHKFISDLGISKVSLSVEDMESILYTLVLDNKAERSLNAKGLHLYRAINTFLAPPGIVKSTCGICPIEARCAEAGLVNPKVCSYLNDWLNE